MSTTVVFRPKTPGLRRRWLPTFMWLCLQAAFSTDSFSAEHTGSLLWSIVHAIYPGISQDQFEVLHFFIRKAAHFCTYGILSVFAFYSWRATFPVPVRTTRADEAIEPSASGTAASPSTSGIVESQPWALRWSVLAVLTALVAGSFDEFHQAFVPSRTASPRDVLLDVTGAICFQLVLAAILTRRQRTQTLRSPDNPSTGSTDTLPPSKLT